MARANRLGGGYAGTFQVTHRCHNREFLLKFALDRDSYRAKLRDHLREFEVALLDYCITSNHVHLLLDAEERMNAFWGNNLHATLVEEGTYLSGALDSAGAAPFLRDENGLKKCA